MTTDLEVLNSYLCEFLDEFRQIKAELRQIVKLMEAAKND